MRTVELAVQIAAAVSMGCAITAFKAARFASVEAASAITRRIQPEATR
jgi:hypothetical protein